MENARDHLFDLGSLENYTFTDEVGKDQGINGEKNAFFLCYCNLNIIIRRNSTEYPYIPTLFKFYNFVCYP